jgi:hypothetical protein
MCNVLSPEENLPGNSGSGCATLSLACILLKILRGND